MNTIKTILASVILALCATLSMSADNVILRVNLNDCTSVLIDLGEPRSWSEHDPMLYPTTRALVFKAQNGDFEIPVENLRADHPVEVFLGEASGIEDVKAASGSFSMTPVDAGSILITGSDMLSLDNVNVYDLGGRKVSADVIKTDGGIMVSLDKLPAGLYLINALNTTIKFSRR